MANIWKTEYHVIRRGGDTDSYHDDKAEAVAHAQTVDGAYVMAVTEYHVDRERVWPADADEDAA